MNSLILANICILLIVKYDISCSTCCTREKNLILKLRAFSLINYFLFMKKF